MPRDEQYVFHFNLHCRVATRTELIPGTFVLLLLLN